MKKYADKALRLLSVSFVFTVVSVVVSSFLIGNLGNIIGALLPSNSGGEYDFALIFEQTKNARLSFPFAIPFALGGLFYLAVKYVFVNLRNLRVRRALNVVSCCLLLLISFIAVLLMTKVNGIRFCDLLYKLIPLIDKL